MKIIDIGQDFSRDPLGRYRSDGNASGEAFREDILLPALRALKDGEKITLILDNGVESYGSSFLTEGFAGVVKYGHMSARDLLKILSFKYTNPDFEFYRDKIVKYCLESQFNSKSYTG